jgi:hypothetical protein
MAYIGRGLDNGVRNQFVYAATQGQTAFTGADSDGKTLAMTDILYTDCYQNGVKLKPTTDYTVSLTTLTLISAASVNDVINIVAFDIFAVPDTVPASTGGTFNGGIGATTGTFSGNVGIKTTSPESYYAKDLALKALDEGGITIAGNGANQQQYLMFADGTSGAERFRGYIGYDHNIDMMQMVSGGSTKFLVNNSAERMRVTNDGLTFNGDTAAANALDDYEEGTYTATIACASGSITLHSSFNELAYTKVGRVVHVQGFLKVSSVSSPTGATNLNLPFTAIQTTDHAGRADNLGYAFLNGSAVTNGYYILFNELLHNQANNRIFWDNNNSGNNIGDNATAADTDIRMNFSYMAA